MKKNSFLIGILAIVLVFGMTVVGCGSDDDGGSGADGGGGTTGSGGGGGTVTGGNGTGTGNGGDTGTGSGGGSGDTFSKAYTNMVVVYSTGQQNTGTFNFLENVSSLGTGEWEARVTGGNFSLKLGTLYSNLLYGIGDLGSGVTVSNPQTKGADINYFSTGNPKKYLYYSNSNWGKDNSLSSYPKVHVRFVYVDRDVNAIGSYTEDLPTAEYKCTYIHNQHLKKGWNIVIHTITYTKVGTIDTYTETHTTEDTPGTDLKWYIFDNRPNP